MMKKDREKAASRFMAAVVLTVWAAGCLAGGVPAEGAVMKAAEGAVMKAAEGTVMKLAEGAVPGPTVRLAERAVVQAAAVMAAGPGGKAAVKTKGEPGTPAELHGALRVQGSDLVDAKGEKFQLYGMSTHGLAWFPQYVNPESFRTLRDDWGTNCVRLAMYTDEYGGYCSGGNKEELKKLVSEGVSYATELGMYVIVDWHVLNDRDPNVHKKEAMEFFDEMAAKWKDQDNIIYEICNEPNSGVTWEGIRAYANEVIPVIRRHDKDAVIIVGTPAWSQEVDQAQKNPLEFDNVMYALHFYAATHTDWLRSRCEEAVKAGLPVFISEFGMCDASGGGANDFGQADQWMELIDKYNLSCCCWNLANKNERCCVIKPECGKTSGWTAEDLSDSGQWIRSRFRKNSGKTD